MCVDDGVFVGERSAVERRRRQGGCAASNVARRIPVKPTECVKCISGITTRDRTPCRSRAAAFT